MRRSRLFGEVMPVQGMVVEDVEFRPDPDGREGQVLVVSVRPYARLASRCPECGRRCPGYDRAEHRRRWRTLDVGVAKTYLEAPAPRVECAEHGVVTASVPWARPRVMTTYLLEDTTAWLAKAMALSLVTVFLRLSWRTVQAIITRVVADRLARTDRLAGLRRIGIDEISYRKGQRYLLVTWNQTAWHRPPRRGCDKHDDGGAVAGVGAARACDRVVAGLGRPGSCSSDDRGVRAGADRVPALV